MLVGDHTPRAETRLRRKETPPWSRRPQHHHRRQATAAILILIFDGSELLAARSECYDVSLFPQAEEEAV